jgi:opacity protein-like surface antigen
MTTQTAAQSKRRVGLTAVIAIVIGAASASIGATARAEGPPADVQKLIDQMAGTWSVKGAAIQVQGKTMKSDSQAVCDKAAGGWVLRCKVTATTGDRRDELVQILSWDRPSGAFHLYSANNSGDSHDHTGSFDGKTLSLKYEGNRDGKPYVETLAFTLRGPRELGWKDTCSVGGEVVFSGEAIYRK